MVLHADTSSDRFESAKTLLSYAFANYDIAPLRPAEALPPVRVVLGAEDSVQPVYDGGEYVLEERGVLSDLRYQVELAESVEAPVAAGQKLGSLTVESGGEVLTVLDITASQGVERLTFGDVYSMMMGALFGRIS